MRLKREIEELIKLLRSSGVICSSSMLSLVRRQGTMSLLDQIITKIDDYDEYDRIDVELENLEMEKYLETKSDSLGDPLECYDSDRLRCFCVAELKGKNKVEKDRPPNISLHAFYVIDHAKTALESKCPGIVSCADILALAARDAVPLSGSPTWEVPKGRKDGRISLATEIRQLPVSTFNISQLQQNFAHRGLAIEDLVALSGGHTLGFSHCSSFHNRIHNFSATLDVDPTMNPPFAARLRSVCPAHNKVKNARSPLDSSNFVFDNAYYKLLFQGKSIFSSDQALLTTPKTKALVSKFASSQKAFENVFFNSMIKMSSFTSGQEIRLDCRVVR
ncbi:hypothetical protein REPUB_Repub03eG0137600 [Reevesia pubescens]